MSNTIKDGTGKGYQAKVGEDNRIRSQSISVTLEQKASVDGNAFGVSSGIVTLTSDSESAIFYIKNNTDDDLLIIEQFLLFGTSTGGSGSPTIKYYTGADSSGTIVSTANEITSVNRRFLDSTVLDVDAYYGAEGLTLSGGTQSSFVTNGFTNTGTFLIPKGIALGISVTPPTGNTNQAFTFGLNLIKDPSQYTK
jgi:hypothetical protein